MNITFKVLRLLILAALVSLTACSSIPMPKNAKATSSEPEAIALLEQSQQAHGKAAFAAIKDISVSYNGKWSYLITRIQPAITDIAFRETSEERMLLKDTLLAQIHSASGGKKTVIRNKGTSSIWYNQKPHTSPEQIAASSLVIEAYQLFLYPAFYVQRAALLERAGTSVVNGRDCDVLLAVLRPGIGNSPEDRVLLSIDKQDKLVRRVWFTLEGTETTKGAVVSVAHDSFVEVGGVKWPTHFYESIVNPFPGLPAHDFSLTGIDLNRGLTVADFADGKFSERASKPALALPAKK
jgi:hypothetical protein